jgi:hypothetical protein
MAKSDLLKEAIADARAVKETALANAKIALQEAFAPRIQSMLSAKLSEELEDEEMPEDEMGADVDLDGAPAELPVGDEMGGDDMGADVGDLSIDVDNNGEFDEFDIFSKEPLAGTEDEMGAPEAGVEDMNPEDEYNEGYEHEDELNLEAIIRELEGDVDNEMPEDLGLESEPADEMDDMNEDLNIDEIIESILREEEFSAEQDVDVPSKDEDGIVSDLKNEVAEKEEELQEAYKTVHQLKSIINEVNLLNAKLLYTNKLFRNFELNDSQKMKVIENFDRAGNTREVKLVFTTLAESFKRPTTKKRVVKESYASKATATTKPSKPIITEGFDQAERWKKLAGLL